MTKTANGDWKEDLAWATEHNKAVERGDGVEMALSYDAFSHAIFQLVDTWTGDYSFICFAFIGSCISSPPLHISFELCFF